MDIVLNDSATQAQLKALPLKRNLLKGTLPELLDADGRPFAAKTGNIKQVTDNRLMCDFGHVQLHAKLPLTVTYALNPADSVKRLLVSTYVSAYDYGYGRYEIYLSNDRESLYAPEHKLAEYDRRGRFDSGNVFSGTAQIFTLNEAGNFSFFGIKFTHGCQADGVVRLDLAGAFAEVTPEENLALQRLGANLTDDAETVFLNGETEFYFSAPVRIDRLLVRDPNTPVYAFPSETGVLPERLNLSFQPVSYAAKTGYLSEQSFSAAGLRSAGNNIIGAFTADINLTVLPDQIINPDFLGAGTNVLPTVLMEESLKAGYDPAFFEQEKAAIRTVRPKIVRVWFQNDWFQTGPDTYDFTLPKMKAFLDYMEVFRELGTEIELDFSFAVGSPLHSWYTIKEVPDQGRSAPKDLKQFARSVKAALEFLCDRQGFAIKYLTISNEPENRNFAVDGDMQAKIEYYAAALREIDAVLKQAGTRDRFELWAAEDSAHTEKEVWLREMHRLAGDVIDRYTKHAYRSHNNDLLLHDIPNYKSATENSPVCLTEFGANIPTYEKSTVGAFLAAANGGLDAALHWCLSAAMLPDPLFGTFEAPICLWRNKDYSNDRLSINPICHEFGSVIRYVPPHSRVLKSVCDLPDDLRAAAFEKDGEVTVVVEAKGSGLRTLQLRLGSLTEKPFYRIFCDIESGQTPEQLLPDPKPVSVENGVLTDLLEAKHCLYVYTTLADA